MYGKIGMIIAAALVLLGAAPVMAADGSTVYKGQDYSRVFDAKYYVARYPSVKKKCGTSEKKLLANFVKTGMKKGRQGNAAFNVKSYIYGNKDLRKKYKNSLKKYYLHYQNAGYADPLRVKTAKGIKKMQNAETVLDGIDYSPVYDYAYYIKKHPELLKRYGYRDTPVLKYYVKHGFPVNEKAKKSVSKNARDKIAKQKIAKALAKTETAKKTDQIILVVDHTLSLWNRKSGGSWKRAMKAYCGYGKNGLSSNRHEGDLTTPIGSFPVLHAFGSAANPGTAMRWKKITANSYWSGEQSTYNTWVESRRRVSGEHLIDYYQYAYAMAIGFNRNPTVYKKGSAIFLHCKSTDHWYTGGCVSVKKSVMKKLLCACHDGCYILIVPDESKISKY